MVFNGSRGSQDKRAYFGGSINKAQHNIGHLFSVE